jgi:hypothetical protein
MIRKTVFISCGQFTAEEKQLGKDIVKLVRDSTDLTPFFAEEVHDLNGLDSNILAALHDCAAFITVLHPRGEIVRPDGSKLIRASTWIEQEIAIATYIKRTEKRQLPIIAFIHKSVGLEGIRSLIHINPIQFSNEAEIIALLPGFLSQWKTLRPSGIELLMTSRPLYVQDEHPIRRLEISLSNKTNKRISDYEIEVLLPPGILKHWNSHYPAERRCDTPSMRAFRFDHGGRGPVPPHATMENPIIFEYCVSCAMGEYREDSTIAGLLASELKLVATAWVNDEEVRIEKTIKQLATER